jgi:multicomponent Na+:H+ antiporter subunit C
VLVLLAALIGILFATGVFLMLRRSTVDLIFGLLLLSHAANLLVFTAGGILRDAPPLMVGLPQDAEVADPVPQALVLTAIVISFAVVAFAMVLVARLYGAMGTDDSEQFRNEGQP